MVTTREAPTTLFKPWQRVLVRVGVDQRLANHAGQLGKGRRVDRAARCPPTSRPQIG